MRTLVHRFAAGLLGLGLRKGERVALIAEGRRDWVVAELGILSIGAIDVPVSVKLDELGDLRFRLAHSGCRMAVVSKGQVAKIRRVRADLPDLILTIVLDELADFGPGEMSAAEVMRRGEELLASRRAEFESARRPSRRAIRPISATPRARPRTPRASS